MKEYAVELRVGTFLRKDRDILGFMVVVSFVVSILTRVVISSTATAVQRNCVQYFGDGNFMF